MPVDFVVDETPPPAEVWYRVVDLRYAPTLDEWDRPQGNGRSAVQVREYPVLRHTERGVWLEGYGETGRRFVLRDARKRFACPTREEAWESFRARKQKQLRLLTAQIAHVRRVLEMEATDGD
jgi:hypothetical protein